METVGEAHRSLAESDGNLWIVGAILVLIGTVGQNLGNNIVSVAHQAEHAREDEKEDLQAIAEKDEEENEDAMMKKKALLVL